MAENADSQIRIFLWCVPRTVSTAFTKCMSFVDGMQIWHEPYTAAYLNKHLYNPEFLKDNPQMQTIRQVSAEKMSTFLQAMKMFPKGNLTDQTSFSYSWVKSQLQIAPTTGKRHIFCKDMAWSIDSNYDNVPSQVYRHTFLIRNPAKVFSSWKNVMVENIFPGQNPDQYDFLEAFPFINSKECFKYLRNLWKHATEEGNKPLIIDSDDLVNFPEKILPKYFEELGLPWDEKLLTWEENQNIIQTWDASFELTIGGGMSSTYSRAFNSSCFAKSSKDKNTIDVNQLTPDLKRCVEYSIPFYQEMYEQRIKVDS